MRIDLVSLLLLVLCFSGCIVWDADYTKDSPVRNSEARVDQKVPIGYSVELKREGAEVVASPNLLGLREKIEGALKATGLFSDISYGEKGLEDSYHLTFRFRQGFVEEDPSSVLGVLSGCTFTAIPNVEISTFDGIAELSLQGKIIYTTVKAEEIRYFIWLPMAPVGLFMNSWSAWDSAETGTINALVNDVADFHKGKFL